MSATARRQTAVKQWGNSAGVRISREVLEESKLKLDDVLEVVTASNGIIVLKKQGQKKFSDIVKPLVDTKGWRFDREDANER